MTITMAVAIITIITMAAANITTIIKSKWNREAAARKGCRFFLVGRPQFYI
jgi:hypothetical protein